MPVTRSKFSALYEPGLRKVLFENYTYSPEEYSMFLNVGGTGNVKFLEDYEMGGFGGVPVKPEGVGITYDEPVPGNKVRYEWTPFGKGVRITHEAIADELYGQMRKMVAALGRAFRHQEEISGASILNSAFTVSGGFDNMPLCDLAHPNLRGGTQRNEPSSPVDISVAALQAALVDFEKFTDHSGVPVVVKPRYLVHTPESIPIVREILGSNLKPYVATNETNILESWLIPIVSHYMVDPDAWFILADKGVHDLHFYWREKFTPGSEEDFDTGDAKMKGYYRHGVGWGSYVGVWGSPGV